jgi:hypothetical protein
MQKQKSMSNMAERVAAATAEVVSSTGSKTLPCNHYSVLHNHHHHHYNNHHPQVFQPE